MDGLSKGKRGEVFQMGEIIKAPLLCFVEHSPIRKASIWEWLSHQHESKTSFLLVHFIRLAEIHAVDFEIVRRRLKNRNLFIRDSKLMTEFDTDSFTFPTMAKRELFFPCSPLRKLGCQQGFRQSKTTGGFFLSLSPFLWHQQQIIISNRNRDESSTHNKPDPTAIAIVFSTIMKGANNIILYLGLAAISFQIASWESVEGFQPSIQGATKQNILSLSAFKVSVDELEKDLTPGERSVTGVVRKCGPSVALIRSVLPSASSSTTSTRRRGRTRRTPPRTRPTDDNLPRGSDLGSGSGFLVSSEGYICTNFHVIEQAYTIRRNAEMAEQTFDELAGNLTGGIITHDLLNITKSLLQQQFQGIFDVDSLPVVYAKISSSNRFQKCRIVDVNPDIDLAVLKIMDESANTTTTASENSIAFGSSGDLLVGQTVVAIGNPFGLQSSVSCGVVSALDRQLATNQRPANIPIRNAIQTDAAINPGNSGGPLLNLRGEVVGINTAIITTSGSSAGIGFAVPSDQIQPVVQRILQKDRIENGVRPNMGWLGISVVTQSVAIPEAASFNNSGDTNTTSVVPPLARCKNWIESVEPNSPAEAAELQPLTIQDGVVKYGDAILAVGGNQVSDFEELRAELEKCVVGEQVALTVQDAEDKKRVVYATLSRKPTA